MPYAAPTTRQSSSWSRLRDRVDRRRDERLRLPRRHRRRARRRTRAAASPSSRASSCSSGARPGRDAAVLGAHVLALAVDRHRRGDHEPLEPVGHARRAARGTSPSPCVFAAHVALDLVHRLAHADRAARCTTSSTPSERLREDLGSATSPRTGRPPAGPAGRHRGPAARASRARRRCGRGGEPPHECAPMNPAPPVTNVFITTSHRGQGLFRLLVGAGSAGRTPTLRIEPAWRRGAPALSACLPDRLGAGPTYCADAVGRWCCTSLSRASKAFTTAIAATTSGSSFASARI